MWVCPDCNQLVPQPMKGKRCPNGHGLFDRRIFGSTNEQSFGRAFVDTLIMCVIVFIVVAALGALLTATPVTTIGGIALFAFAYFAVSAFLRGRHWNNQGGPVTKLVPRANGMAAAYLAAAACLLIIGVIANTLR